jgi:hypothetical protein
LDAVNNPYLNYETDYSLYYSMLFNFSVTVKKYLGEILLKKRKHLFSVAVLEVSVHGQLGPLLLGL